MSLETQKTATMSKTESRDNVLRDHNVNSPFAAMTGAGKSLNPLHMMLGSVFDGGKQNNNDNSRNAKCGGVDEG